MIARLADWMDPYGAWRKLLRAVAWRIRHPRGV